MNVKEIRHGSTEYRQECALRQEVLRKPLGVNLYDENLDAEQGQTPVGALPPRTSQYPAFSEKSSKVKHLKTQKILSKKIHLDFFLKKQYF